MYSNCLFEAVKAKIKDPKNVKIIRLPKGVNAGIRHFMWIKEDTVFHAYNAGKTNNPIFFKYKVKEIKLETFKRWLLGQLAGTRHFLKYAEKFQLPLFDERTVTGYSKIYSTDKDHPFYNENYKWPVDVYEKVKALMKSEPQVKVIDLVNDKMHIVSFAELQNMQGTFKYKFITPYDEHTFLEIYGNGSRLVTEKEIAD